jgi:antitoxin component YwqK of YwqJK toxin-antitoxin module
MRYVDGTVYDGGYHNNERYGIGETRNCDGTMIEKCLYANGKRNGISLKWMPDGSLSQVTFNDDRKIDLLLLDTASGESAASEIQDNKNEGLSAFYYTSDGIAWVTWSKD